MNIGCSWSGGKDSCFALMETLGKDFQLRALVNMMNENGLISRSHGLPISILQQQADAMNVSLITRATSWNKYQDNFIESLEIIANDYDVKAIVFGDIDLQQHRDWEEMVCSKVGLSAILPLWKIDRKELVMKMLNEGIECMIVSCNTTMGERFTGRVMTLELVAELEKMGIDVCGENGEFHTVVINCPLFQHPIRLPAYSTILHENYWFLQWQS